MAGPMPDAAAAGSKLSWTDRRPSDTIPDRLAGVLAIDPVISIEPSGKRRAPERSNTP
jgi:hypothetical protein